MGNRRIGERSRGSRRAAGRESPMAPGLLNLPCGRLVHQSLSPRLHSPRPCAGGLLAAIVLACRGVRYLAGSPGPGLSSELMMTALVARLLHCCMLAGLSGSCSCLCWAEFSLGAVNDARVRPFTAALRVRPLSSQQTRWVVLPTLATFVVWDGGL